MKNWSTQIIFFSLVFLVSLAGSLAGMRMFGRQPQPEPARKPQGGHLGRTEPWLHQQLKLTAEQKASLQARQENFMQEELRLERLMAEAQDELSNLIRAEQQVTPAMLACLKRINDSHGELQQITLTHLFDTYAELDLSRQKLLLELASDALDDPLQNLENQLPLPVPNPAEKL